MNDNNSSQKCNYILEPLNKEINIECKDDNNLEQKQLNIDSSYENDTFGIPKTSSITKSDDRLLNKDNRAELAHKILGELEQAKIKEIEDYIKEAKSM